MKVYKVELLIIDFDQLGANEIKDVFKSTRYPNHCIHPNIMNIEERDIGEWDDKLPINNKDTIKSEYERLFGKSYE